MKRDRILLIEGGTVKQADVDRNVLPPLQKLLSDTKK